MAENRCIRAQHPRRERAPGNCTDAQGRANAALGQEPVAACVALPPHILWVAARAWIRATLHVTRGANALPRAPGFVQPCTSQGCAGAAVREKGHGWTFQHHVREVNARASITGFGCILAAPTAMNWTVPCFARPEAGRRVFSRRCRRPDDSDFRSVRLQVGRPPSRVARLSTQPVSSLLRLQRG